MPRLLQRIQNMQNELIINQNRNFSRVQAINAKILAKYSLNLTDLEQRAFKDDTEIEEAKARQLERQRQAEVGNDTEEASDEECKTFNFTD